ncbi:MAG: response regulator transcription factor [Cyclobacteriaceae bacterium]
MSEMKCLIVDDESLARTVIENYINDVEGLALVASVSSAVEALGALQKHPIDLIFLDIEMPKLSGLDFLDSLKSPPKTIITTAHRDYAVESYEYEVVDYLLKPIRFSRFLKAVNKLINTKPVNTKSTHSKSAATVESKEIDHIFLKADKKLVKVYYEAIICIESLKDYVKVKTRDGDLIVHFNLQQITNILPAKKFVRVHRSFTIPIKKVAAINGNQIEIEGQKIPIGRNYQKDIKALLLG